VSWLDYLIALHRDKDAAYGDAWCRRGEAAGIFPNIARKYDRWARIRSQTTPEPAAVEPLDDTLADLCIYAVKYLVWLRERHPEIARGVPANLTTVNDGLTALTSHPLTVAGEEILVESFTALELSFVDSDRSTTEASNSVERAMHTWNLARGAWQLLQPLPVPSPGSMPETEAPPVSPGTSSFQIAGLAAPALAEALLTQLLPRLISEPGPVLLLGRTADSVYLTMQLKMLGLGHSLLGIADPDIPVGDHQGGSVPWARVAALEPRYLVVCSDEHKERLLRGFVATQRPGEMLPSVVLSGMAHLTFNDPAFTESDAPAMVPSYATGYPYTRIHMFQHLQAAARNGLTGAIVEFGAFKGGTTAWLARTARQLGLDIPIIAFDSWDGFPPRRSVLDMYEHPRCVFRDLPAVRAYLAPLGVELVEGDISDTVARLRGTPVLLSFIDTDNYSPAYAALTTIADNIVPGGAIVFDHYTTSRDYLYTLGERMAGQDVLGDRGFFHVHESGVFVRLPDNDLSGRRIRSGTERTAAE
jgi:O-methyltransferase